MISSYTQAYEKTICFSREKNEAKIYLNFPNRNSPLPCEVRYRFNGNDAVLWSTDTQENSCEKKAKDLELKHKNNWGWQCMLLNDYQPQPETNIIRSQLDPVINQEINEFETAAELAQIIQAMTPFTMMTLEYEMDRGSKAENLEELGINRSELTGSRAIQDLNIGEDGAVYALATEHIGTNVIVRIENISVLAGTSFERRCSVNIKATRIDSCTYDPTLKFPE